MSLQLSFTNPFAKKMTKRLVKKLIGTSKIPLPTMLVPLGNPEKFAEWDWTLDHFFDLLGNKGTFLITRNEAFDVEKKHLQGLHPFLQSILDQNQRGGGDCFQNKDLCLECVADWYFGLKENVYEQLNRIEQKLQSSGVFSKIDQILLEEINSSPTESLKRELTEKFYDRSRERKENLLREAKQYFWKEIVDVNTNEEIMDEYRSRVDKCESIKPQRRNRRKKVFSVSSRQDGKN